MMTEIMVALDLARYYARSARHTLSPQSLTPFNVAMWRKRVRITNEPYGIIGIISPWNYPFMLPAGVLIPALIAGNSVVIKPSELTPTSGVLLGELMRDAGVPAGVLAVLPGDGQTGAALASSAIDKLFFTGSVATGRRVAVACAERLIPCVLELGGSDPAIVLEDADIETAASGILWGRFSNAGQTCVAPKRVFVVDAVYDRFIERLAAAVRALRAGGGSDGDAGDMGPLIRPRQAEQLAQQLADAVGRGARLLAGGSRSGADGALLAPSLIDNVTPAMQVMREETFGPVLPVVRVRDSEEAVRRANESPFGLSASIWSRDLTRARALARQIHAGTVMVNDSVTLVGIAEVPHGGVKESGSGRSHGRAGLLECVGTKTIVVDWLPGVRQPWWFGYGADREGNLDAFVRLWHGASLRERAGGVWRSIRMLLVHERPL